MISKIEKRGILVLDSEISICGILGQDPCLPSPEATRTKASSLFNFYTEQLNHSPAKMRLRYFWSS